MTIAARSLEFDAGHRLVGHESKCAHLHGHRYKAIVEVQAPELDTVGRVIDFGCIKYLVGTWINDNWDHNLILNPEDPLLKVANEHWEQYEAIFGIKAPFLMPSNCPNPTAENMCTVLWEMARLLLPEELSLARVRLYETPNCYAERTEAPALLVW